MTQPQRHIRYAVAEGPILQCLRQNAKLVPEPDAEGAVVLGPEVVRRRSLWLPDERRIATEEDMRTNPALTRLADGMTALLQIERCLTRTFAEGHKVGQKPLTLELIESVLARDLDDLEPRLTRHGYNAKALADLVHVRPTAIRTFLAARLPPSRMQELP